MKIIIDRSNEDRQYPIITIDTSTCHYPYAIREAIEKALELDGCMPDTIDEVFGRRNAEVKSEGTSAMPVAEPNTLFGNVGISDDKIVFRTNGTDYNGHCDNCGSTLYVRSVLPDSKKLCIHCFNGFGNENAGKNTGDKTE